MDNETKDVILGIMFILIIVGGFFFAVGFICGNDTTSHDTKRQLCKEFMTKTTDYISCNSDNKSLTDVIMMIKVQENNQ